jgi:hypothetical protein
MTVFAVLCGFVAGIIVTLVVAVAIAGGEE